ncbi:hypothetical protein HPB50_017999 [Hyalomma asiaticum]|uniref:Uncharacterized protein n=1 Tax=Hyalomma asiaticum TaxID=266040 RepID=A0ACB7SNP1_HYAAI|nr:hypothetical protein HPB50_017999 [Hyalomma asiaticum]
MTWATEGKRVVVLGHASVPDHVTRLLEKEPKYAVQFTVHPHNLIGLNRDLSIRVMVPFDNGKMNQDQWYTSPK